MKKLTEQQIKEGNRIIAEFMGYIYYHKGVDIDFSECGGIYDRCEIFSKVPILVNEYPENDEYTFKEVPNPDFKNKKNPKWNPDYENLGWETINYGEYKTHLSINYNEDYNRLNKVIEKIKEMKYPIMIYQSHIQNTVEIYDLKGEHYIVRESSTMLKPIEVLWLAIVNFIKIQNKNAK